MCRNCKILLVLRSSHHIILVQILHSILLRRILLVLRRIRSKELKVQLLLDQHLLRIHSILLLTLLRVLLRNKARILLRVLHNRRKLRSRSS
jgi:hypothetical protein